MSQVRNLRAMFEQKPDTTSPPDDRGRSPGVTSTGTESPRPLSKVRTNFIAIEKDGRIGLQREPSRDSNASVSTRKPSSELGSPPAVPEESIAPAENTPTKANLRNHSIPELPRSGTGSEATSLPATKPTATKAAKAQPARPNPENKVGVKQVHAKMAPGALTDKAAVSGGGSTLSNGGEALNGTGVGKVKGQAVSKEASITSSGGPSKAATRTVPILTAKTSAKPAKSPTVAKAPKSPATTTTPKANTKTPDKKMTHPEKTATPRAATSAAKSSGSTSIQRPPPLQPSPSGTGFIKPKVKSPTRPVKLPPGLTTHTAASGSKVNASRQSLSRASGIYPHADSQGRSPSRVSVSTVGTTRTSGTTAKPLKRQNSTINRPRPSFGPPPKPVARDHPPTKREKEVDEGFLARMMRPTQASSSKTAEKAALSPPRKANPAPVLKKTAVPKQDLKTLKKPTAKTTPVVASNTDREAQSSSAHGAAPVTEKPSTQEVAPVAEAAPAAEPSSTQDVTPVVEQPAAAEEVISVAKEVEGPVSLPEDAGRETTTQETVPVVEQPETVQEVSEVAMSADGGAIPPAEGNVDAGDNEVPSSEVAEEPEQAAAVSPEFGEPEPVEAEAPTVNGDHEKPTPVDENPGSAEVAPESVDEPEAEDVVDTKSETEAAA